ncbi:Uncharacterised protein [Enterobacter cloacae]|nr:Uncharacterised protein [Enterobacter cloacae]
MRCGIYLGYFHCCIWKITFIGCERPALTNDGEENGRDLISRSEITYSKLSSEVIFCALIIKHGYIFLFSYCSEHFIAAHKLGVSAAVTVNLTQKVLPLLHISFTSFQHLPFQAFTRHASFVSATVFVCRLTYFVIKVLFRT